MSAEYTKPEEASAEEIVLCEVIAEAPMRQFELRMSVLSKVLEDNEDISMSRNDDSSVPDVEPSTDSLATDVHDDVCNCTDTSDVTL